MLAAGLIALAAGPLGAAPRPLTEAETAALGLATRYLSGGAAAWWDELAEAAPLRRLGREAAEAEIEVRAGSVEGSRWTLQTAVEADADAAFIRIEYPTGADDTLTLSFLRQAGELRLFEVRIAAEPAPPGPGVGAVVARPSRPAAAAGGPGSRLAGTAAVLGLLLAGTMAARRRPRLLAAAVPVVALLLSVGGGCGPGADRPPAGSPAAEAESAGPAADPAGEAPELRELAELRRALTAGGALEAAAETGPPADPRARAALLWRTQRLLAAQDLNAAAELLDLLPTPGQVPLTELLRARLAVQRLDEIEAGLAYERALESGGVHDGLLLEAAQAFSLLGFETRAERYFEDLRRLGSRDAEVYYSLAQYTARDGRGKQAVELLETAWALNPVERREILERPLLAALVSDFSVRDLLAVASPLEPAARCDAAPRGAGLELPLEAASRVLGRLLEIEIGGARLEVPAGCALAPLEAAVYDAASWRERREVLVLAELPALLEAVRSPGALGRPTLQRRLEEAVEALSSRNRWQELVDLTAGIESQIARVPTGLVQWRADALQRLGRESEARTLLVALAHNNVAQRRWNPGALYQLADLLAAQEEYDLAIRLVARANSQMPVEGSEFRLRELRLEQRLARSFAVHRTAAFEIRYPAGRNSYLAERVGEILEAERQRLGRWIPARSGSRIEVHLLPWTDFQSTWTQNVEILGLYDGKIRLPFADVVAFIPEVVAIMTHELAHALIAEHTGNQAPKWFHEGLAQHVQMVQARLNPIQGYQIKRNLLAFPLLESVLKSFASPVMVGVAYDEALWTLHFIEERFGRRAIRGLLDEFAAGSTTQRAIESVFGRSLEEFDRELWRWCLEEAPAAWSTEVVRYDA